METSELFDSVERAAASKANFERNLHKARFDRCTQVLKDRAAFNGVEGNTRGLVAQMNSRGEDKAATRAAKTQSVTHDT